MLINGVDIEIVRKPVKNLRLVVHPPLGLVKLTTPTYVSEASAKRFILKNWQWIINKQAMFAARPAPVGKQLVSGEEICFMGQRYRLIVEEKAGRSELVVGDDNSLLMRIAADASLIQKQALLDKWYRQALQQRIPLLVKKWEAIMGVEVKEWRVKRMKTRWGTCNAAARRIWLGLELATKHPLCLEYVVVHEMVHFFERYHNERFKGLMDSFLPEWRQYKAWLTVSV